MGRKWLVYAQHECLQLVGPCHGGDHIVAAMNLRRCPRCGEPCTLNYRDTWARVVRRRVRDWVWYRPSTWGRWHWEYRLLGHLEESGYDFRKYRRNAPAAGDEGAHDPPSVAQTTCGRTP